MTTSSIQVYVGTYAKYNSGNLKGEWVDLETYNDEDLFNEHIAELHSDEEDPEFMFQDYEGFPSQFYSESGLDSELWDWLALDDDDREIYSAFLDCFGSGSIENALNAYMGEYDSDRDFAEELLESTWDLQSIPKNLRYYFDYDAYARDLMMDFSSSNNRYFSSNW